MYECMNRKMMNSKNLGARSMKNGALDRKIWLWKLSRVKRSLQEVLGGVYFEWLGSFDAKEQGLLRSLGNFQGFLWIFEAFGVV
jgi:hypothetical protein